MPLSLLAGTLLTGSSDPSAFRQLFGRVFGMKPVIQCFLNTSMRHAPGGSEGLLYCSALAGPGSGVLTWTGVLQISSASSSAVGDHFDVDDLKVDAWGGN